MNHIKQMDFSHIKVGAHIVLKDVYPCKITDVAFSKPGKHGHAKKSVTGVDVITDKKYEQIFTHHSIIKIPEITRTVYQLCDIDDGFMSLMDNITCDTRQDICLPDNEIGRDIQQRFNNGDGMLITILIVKVDEDVMYRLDKVVENREN